MIPLHPRPGPDPQTVHWHVPAGSLPVRGRVTTVPGPLAALVGAGVVTEVVVRADHLAVTLAPGGSWRGDGPRVRSALLAALEDPAGWETAPGGGTGPDGAGDGATAPRTGEDDATLREAAEAAIAGGVGELAHSHGGAITLESVEGGVVTVRMRGACSGCPAAGLTLHARLEEDLRAAHPGLREVRAVDEGRGHRGRVLLGLIGRRPG